MKRRDFAAHLTAFFTSYLGAQLGVSAHTLHSYRDTFAMFLRWCDRELHVPPHRLSLDVFEPKAILAFLDHLQSDRNNSIATRNQRLSALHAFMRYVQLEDPTRAAQAQRVLAVRTRRAPRPPVRYLSVDEVAGILAQPDLTTRGGRRDAFLLTLLYDTGARCQELIDLRVCDVRLEAPAHATLTGKGGKRRVVPLMTATVTAVRGYLDQRAACAPEDPLFPARNGGRLSRSGVRYILRKYCSAASIAGRTGPHVLRHTKAMHLLQSGAPLIIIRDILGHADVKTTEVYARADLTMKRAALSKAAPAGDGPTVKSWHDDKDLLAWLKAL